MREVIMCNKTVSVARSSLTFFWKFPKFKRLHAAGWVGKAGRIKGRAETSNTAASPPKGTGSSANPNTQPIRWVPMNRSVGTQACLWECGWENSQRAVPQSFCSLSKLSPINDTVCPFRRSVSSPQTCPSLSRQSTCVFQPLGAFIFYVLPSQYSANQRSPLHPLHGALCDFSLCDWHLINEEGLVSLSLRLWWVRGPQN